MGNIITFEQSAGEISFPTQPRLGWLGEFKVSSLLNVQRTEGNTLLAMKGNDFFFFFFTYYISMIMIFGATCDFYTIGTTAVCSLQCAVSFLEKENNLYYTRTL